MKMTITKIERQQKNDKRCSIYIDGAFAFGLSEADVLYYKLSEQSTISETQLDHIVNEVIFEKARDKAFRYIGYKARTKAETVRKLTEEGYPETVIDRVMQLLARYGYIDDEKYAMAYVKERLATKAHGPLRIKQELLEKGIDSATAAKVLTAHPADEGAMARAHLEKKTRGQTKMDEKERRRCYDYLLRRGFSAETARQALKDYLAMDI